MRATVLLLLSGLVAPLLSLADDVPRVADQIALAVLAAPAEWRNGAGVLGFDDSGKLVTLRQTANDLVCFGDDPAQEEISVIGVPGDRHPYRDSHAVPPRPPSQHENGSSEPSAERY